MRPKEKHAYLPVTAMMKFDEDDLKDISQARLAKLVMYEMGHAFGLSRWVWGKKGLLESPSGSGATPMVEYGTLRGGAPERVPVENALEHWRESALDTELMTPHLDHPEDKPMRRVTVGAVQDIGYHVDFVAADPFELPITVSEQGAAVSSRSNRAYRSGLRSEKRLLRGQPG